DTKTPFIRFGWQSEEMIRSGDSDVEAAPNGVVRAGGCGFGSMTSLPSVKATPMQAISEQQARAIRGGGSAYANSAAYTVSLANQSITPVVNGLLNEYQTQAVNQFKMALGSGS
ncbi:hypothetical protein, partial [Pseudomonas sp. 100_A]